MALQPAIQTDRHTGQQVTWHYADGVTAKAITGATITGTITDVSGVTTPISGTTLVTDGPNGVFQWAYGASDTATAGKYTVQFTAAYPDGKPDSSFEMDWEVRVRR